MPEITVDEFRDIIVERPFEEIVQDYIFEGIPYALRDQPENFGILQQHLYDQLELTAINNITVIGSGKTGFSLNPDSFPRQFSDDSDLDILIVDAALFDRIWAIILRWHYPRFYLEIKNHRIWISDRKREIYLGRLMPDKIYFPGIVFPDELTQLRDISTSWFNAFQSLSAHDFLIRRRVTGRLYRTWDHAMMYHVENLRLIKKLI